MQLTAYQISNIYRRKHTDDFEIILIDVMGDRTVSTLEKLFNIYCVDIKNNIIWQVSEEKTGPVRDTDAFVYLAKNELGEIIADRASGFVYKIDPNSGVAEQIDFHK